MDKLLKFIGIRRPEQVITEDISEQDSRRNSHKLSELNNSETSSIDDRISESDTEEDPLERADAKANRVSLDSIDNSIIDTVESFRKALIANDITTLIINDDCLENKEDEDASSSSSSPQDIYFMREFLECCRNARPTIAIISSRNPTFFSEFFDKSCSAESLAGRNFLGQFFYDKSKNEGEENHNKSAAIAKALQQHKKGCCFIYDRNLPELIDTLGPLLEKTNRELTIYEGNKEFIFDNKTFGASSCCEITEKLDSLQKSSKSTLPLSSPITVTSIDPAKPSASRESEV